MITDFIFNYCHTLFTLILVLYVWPRILFIKFLKEKSFFYKIFFCVSSSTVIWTFLICIMALCKTINTISLNIVFFGSLIISILIRIFFYIKNNKDNLSNNIKVTIQFNKVLDKTSEFLSIYKNFDNLFNLFLKIIIFICIILLCRHFIEYASNVYAYGFSDLSRHEVIINKIFKHNIAFDDGFYPIGMHCIIGLCIYMFGLNVHLCIAYACNFFVAVLFIALYYWLKSIFRTNTAICLVFLCLILLINIIVIEDASSRMIYDGLHRLNWTLPQEVVLWAVFVSPVALLRILKSKNKFKSKNNIANIILFALTIAATLTTHYYTTIFQFVTCLSTFVVYIMLLNKSKIKSIFVSIALGAGAGLITFAIGWSISSYLSIAMTWAKNLPSGESKVFENIASVTSSEENIELNKQANDFVSQIDVKIKTIYEDTFMPLFPNFWSFIFLTLVIVSLAVMIILFVKRRADFQNYLPIFLSMLIFFIMYAAPIINITRILESYRIVVCLYCTIFAFCCISFDVLFNELKKRKLTNSNKNN